jgi:predicted SAM-dependent methyltransferase
MKLDIGSGAATKRDEDFTTVDLFDPTADIKATMWELPFAESTVEFIWAEHCLEHVASVQVAPTLREWLRVLKPGAQAIISVPNFDYVARYWLTGPDRRWAEAMVFGHQATEGEFHKVAFTGEVLRADCEAAGFTVKRIELRWTHTQETLQAVCEKPGA